MAETSTVRVREVNLEEALALHPLLECRANIGFLDIHVEEVSDDTDAGHTDVVGEFDGLLDPVDEEGLVSVQRLNGCR